jgi:hypothetical protein
MSDHPHPIHKKLLAAKLVMGTLSAADMVSAAGGAVAAGERGTEVERLAELQDPTPNAAEPLLRDWLRAAGVELPSASSAWTTVFDYYFAAAVLGPSDPREGIREFLSNVVHPRRVTEAPAADASNETPAAEQSGG